MGKIIERRFFVDKLPCGMRLIDFRKCDMKGGLHAVFDYVPLSLWV